MAIEHSVSVAADVVFPGNCLSELWGIVAYINDRLSDSDLGIEYIDAGYGKDSRPVLRIYRKHGAGK